MQSLQLDRIDAGTSENLMLSAPVASAIAEAVARLRYGLVQVTVHDGRVVQLDVTERQRFT